MSRAVAVLGIAVVACSAPSPHAGHRPRGENLEPAEDAGPWRLGERLLRLAESAAAAGDLEAMDRHYTRWRQRFDPIDAPDAAMSTWYVSARAHAAAGDDEAAGERRKQARRLYEALGRPAETPAAHMVAELVFLRAEDTRREVAEFSYPPVPTTFAAIKEVMLRHYEIAVRASAAYSAVGDFGSKAWLAAAVVRIGDVRWCQAEALARSLVPTDVVPAKYRAMRAEMVDGLRDLSRKKWDASAKAGADPIGGIDWTALAQQRLANPPSCSVDR